MLADIVSSKALSVSMKATCITYDVVIMTIEKLLEGKAREITGKQSLKDLRKKGDIQEIDITDDSLKKLNKFLKKYNIDYSILKNNVQENTYALFFRNYDAEILNKAMQNLVAEKFKEKKSIKERIEEAKAKSKKITQEKQISKNTLEKRSEKEL